MFDCCFQSEATSCTSDENSPSGNHLFLPLSDLKGEGALRAPSSAMIPNASPLRSLDEGKGERGKAGGDITPPPFFAILCQGRGIFYEKDRIIFTEPLQ